MSLSQVMRSGRSLVCYVTAGVPSRGADAEYVMACIDNGADVIEIGVPFTDPVADGRVLQAASQTSLANGMTSAKAMDLVREVRSRSDVPIALMGYYNPIFHHGEARYVADAAQAGADALIVPDLPLEESGALRAACRSAGLDLVQLVGPTTSDERMARIARASGGFLYLVSALGTTGARDQIGPEVAGLIARAKKAAGALPVGVGFGISRAEHVGMMLDAGADAAIVGSAIMSRVLAGETPGQVGEFVRSLKSGTSRR